MAFVSASSLTSASTATISTTVDAMTSLVSTKSYQNCPLIGGGPSNPGSASDSMPVIGAGEVGTASIFENE
jgi:hypothetical protein